MHRPSSIDSTCIKPPKCVEGHKESHAKRKDTFHYRVEFDPYHKAPKYELLLNYKKQFWNGKSTTEDIWGRKRYSSELLLPRSKGEGAVRRREGFPRWWHCPMSRCGGGL